MDEITNWFVLCFDASELAFWEKSRNDQIKMRGRMLRPQLFWPRDRLANPGQPLITLEKCLFLSQLMSANFWLLLSEIGHKEGCHRVCISFLTDSQPLSSWAVFAENCIFHPNHQSRRRQILFHSTRNTWRPCEDCLTFNSSSPRTWHEL